MNLKVAVLICISGCSTVARSETTTIPPVRAIAVVVPQTEPQTNPKPKDTPETVKFVVPKNIARKIDTFWARNPDCTANELYALSIVEPARHGTTYTKNSPDYALFKKDALMIKCNAIKALAAQLWYKPNKNYVGSDSFSVIALSPNGSEYDYKYEIEIK